MRSPTLLSIRAQRIVKQSAAAVRLEFELLGIRVPGSEPSATIGPHSVRIIARQSQVGSSGVGAHRIHDADLVPPGVLGRVQRLVSQLQELSRCIEFLGVIGRAHAHGH